MNKFFCTILTSMMLVSYSSSTLAAEPSLNSCQSLKDRIESYQKLETKDGSSDKKEQLRNSRNELEETFFRKGCSKLRKRLKNQ